MKDRAKSSSDHVLSSSSRFHIMITICGNYPILLFPPDWVTGCCIIDVEDPVKCTWWGHQCQYGSLVNASVDKAGLIMRNHCVIMMCVVHNYLLALGAVAFLIDVSCAYFSCQWQNTNLNWMIFVQRLTSFHVLW